MKAPITRRWTAIVLLLFLSLCGMNVQHSWAAPPGGAKKGGTPAKGDPAPSDGAAPDTTVSKSDASGGASATADVSLPSPLTTGSGPSAEAEARMYRAIIASAKDVAAQIARAKRGTPGAPLDTKDTTFIFYDQRFLQDRTQLQIVQIGVANLQTQRNTIQAQLADIQKQEIALRKPLSRGATGGGAAGGAGAGPKLPMAIEAMTPITSSITSLAELFKPTYSSDYAPPPHDPQALVLGTIANGLQAHCLDPAVMPLAPDEIITDLEAVPSDANNSEGEGTSDSDTSATGAEPMPPAIPSSPHLNPISQLLSISNATAVWSARYDTGAEAEALASELTALQNIAKSDTTLPASVKTDINTLVTTSAPVFAGLKENPAVLPAENQVAALKTLFAMVQPEVHDLSGHTDLQRAFGDALIQTQYLDVSYPISQLKAEVAAYIATLSASSASSKGETLGTQVYRAWLVERQLNQSNTYLLNVKVEGIAGGDWTSSSLFGGKSRSASATAQLSYMIFDPSGAILLSGSSLAYAKYVKDDQTLADDNIQIREKEEDSPSPVGGAADVHMK